MSIDTVTKRKSVINNGLPGLALLPPSDASIEAIDRRRLADFYSLGTQVVAHNFWVPDRRESVMTWDEESRSAQSWIQDGRSNQSDWLEETEVPVE